ncbi:hypothetical protein V8J36_06575 [Frigidibacter sp. MR17.14]|uniref:hypothetical protein n=1 Tax=Frigidibacter sp. MR17.14 TaxID=3126509 RepID=UPI0030130975
MTAFERIAEQGPHAVDFLDGAGADLVVAFASIGHDPTRPPSPEFVATATGRGTPAAPRRALFVTDAARSWATAPGFEATLTAAFAQVTARAPVRSLVTLGLSMGAVAALAAARTLPARAVLAFGPQADPALPGETRWRDWTAALPPLRPQLPDTAWTLLFHGLQDDAAQAEAFPPRAGQDHLLYPDQSHSSLVPYLKARGALAGLVEAALAGDRRRLLRIAASTGATRRR